VPHEARIQAVLERLERVDAEERAEGLPRALRSRQIGPETGRLLSALVAHHPGCRVLEIGGSRGYSTIWLAAAARLRGGGGVVSLEADPRKCEDWRRNIAEAGLEAHAELVEGDAFEAIPRLEPGFDVVFIDAEKEDYEALFQLARTKLRPGAVVVADNIESHADPLARYAVARQADPGLLSVTVSLGMGLEISVVLPE
jgi:predicted O-methyltransferase YrrM